MVLYFEKLLLIKKKRSSVHYSNGSVLLLKVEYINNTDMQRESLSLDQKKETLRQGMEVPR